MYLNLFMKEIDRDMSFLKHRSRVHLQLLFKTRLFFGQNLIIYPTHEKIMLTLLHVLRLETVEPTFNLASSDLLPNPINQFCQAYYLSMNNK
ncbi:hypothetical protein Hanom_Chr14g01294761 [Helianthus anomalus]